jgi:hypothetical protein
MLASFYSLFGLRIGRNVMNSLRAMLYYLLYDQSLNGRKDELGRIWKEGIVAELMY